MGTFRVKARAKPRGGVGSRQASSSSMGDTTSSSVVSMESAASSGRDLFRSAFDEMMRQQQFQNASLNSSTKTLVAANTSVAVAQRKDPPLGDARKSNSVVHRMELARIEEGIRQIEQSASADDSHNNNHSQEPLHDENNQVNNNYSLKDAPPPESCTTPCIMPPKEQEASSQETEPLYRKNIYLVPEQAKSAAAHTAAADAVFESSLPNSRRRRKSNSSPSRKNSPSPKSSKRLLGFLGRRRRKSRNKSNETTPPLPPSLAVDNDPQEQEPKNDNAVMQKLMQLSQTNDESVGFVNSDYCEEEDTSTSMVLLSDDDSQQDDSNLQQLYPEEDDDFNQQLYPDEWQHDKEEYHHDQIVESLEPQHDLEQGPVSTSNQVSSDVVSALHKLGLVAEPKKEHGMVASLDGNENEEDHVVNGHDDQQEEEIMVASLDGESEQEDAVLVASLDGQKEEEHVRVVSPDGHEEEEHVLVASLDGHEQDAVLVASDHDDEESILVASVDGLAGGENESDASLDNDVEDFIMDASLDDDDEERFMIASLGDDDEDSFDSFHSDNDGDSQTTTSSDDDHEGSHEEDFHASLPLFEDDFRSNLEPVVEEDAASQTREEESDDVADKQDGLAVTTNPQEPEQDDPAPQDGTGQVASNAQESNDADDRKNASTSAIQHFHRTTGRLTLKNPKRQTYDIIPVSPPPPPPARRLSQNEALILQERRERQKREAEGAALETDEQHQDDQQQQQDDDDNDAFPAPPLVQEDETPAPVVNNKISPNVVSALTQLGIVKTAQRAYESPRGVEDFENQESAVDRIVHLYQEGHISKSEYMTMRRQAMVKEEIERQKGLDTVANVNVAETNVCREEQLEENPYLENSDVAVEIASVSSLGSSVKYQAPTQVTLSPKMVTSHKSSAQRKLMRFVSRKQHYESESMSVRSNSSHKSRGSKKALRRRAARHSLFYSDWEKPEKETGVDCGLKKSRRKSSSSKERHDGDGRRKSKRRHKHRGSSEKRDRKVSLDVVGIHTDSALRAKSQRLRSEQPRERASKVQSIEDFDAISSWRKSGPGKVDSAFVEHAILARRAAKSKSRKSRKSKDERRNHSERLERKGYGDIVDDAIRAKTERSRRSSRTSSGSRGLERRTSSRERRKKSRRKSSRKRDPRLDPTLGAAAVGNVEVEYIACIQPSPFDTERELAMKAAAIRELKTQKRKQEEEFLEGRKSIDVGGGSHGAAEADPALQRFLDLAKRDTQHKRDKLKALKEGVDLTLLPPTAFSKSNSSKRLALSDHPRSHGRYSLHNLFEWNQIQTARRPSGRSNITNGTTMESGKKSDMQDSKRMERKSRREERRGSKSKHESERRHSSQQGERSLHDKSSSTRGDARKSRGSRSSGLSSSEKSIGLGEFLERDRAKGTHGSMQDFIERSVASPYVANGLRRKSAHYRSSQSVAAAPETVTSDILTHFTAKYKALQRDQLKRRASERDVLTTI